MSHTNHTDVVELNAIPVFHTGNYPQGTFDVDYLHQLADSYDPAVHEAPNYLDHEDKTGNRPAGNLAFGWIKRLYVKGDTLLADLVDVPRRFADLILAGRIKKRSVEIYSDLDGKGPYLRALAWPMIPQIKDLADVHPTQIFNDQDSSASADKRFIVIPFHEKENSMTATEKQQPFVTADQLKKMLEDLQTQILTECRKLQAQAEVRTFCEQMVLAGKLEPANREVEEQALIRLKLEELSKNFSESDTVLSRQKMDQIRRREPVIQTGSATTEPVEKVSETERKVARYFSENETFFTRMGVTLNDLLEAEKAQPKV